MALITSFTYTQDSPSNLWRITHNLNLNAPMVSVNVWNNGQLEKIIPKDIRIMDSMVVEVEFTSPYTGVARIL